MGVLDISKERILKILDYADLIFPITIQQLIDVYSKADIYYEILIDKPLEEEWTLDKIFNWAMDYIDYVSSNDESLYNCEGIPEKIYRIGSKQYLKINVLFRDHNLDDILGRLNRKDLNIDATPENMIKAFNSDKLILPRTFKGTVVLEGDDPGNIVEDVIFRFEGIDTYDKRILEYIGVLIY